MIENDYAGAIRRKMDDVYRNAGVGRGEKVERESRAAFIVRSYSYYCHSLSRIDKDADTAERSGRICIAHGTPRKRLAFFARDTPNLPSRRGRGCAREHVVVVQHRAKIPINPACGRRAAV